MKSELEISGDCIKSRKKFRGILKTPDFTDIFQEHVYSPCFHPVFVIILVILLIKPKILRFLFKNRIVF